VPLVEAPGLLPHLQRPRKAEPPSQISPLPAPDLPRPVLPEHLDLAPASDADVKPPHGSR
jgi:hypothetical protein